MFSKSTVISRMYPMTLIASEITMWIPRSPKWSDEKVAATKKTAATNDGATVYY